MYPVAHTYCGKVGTPEFASGRVDAGRGSRDVAAALVAGAQHRTTVGIDRLDVPDAIVAPARFAVFNPEIARSMMTARQSVANQHGIGAIGIELALGFVHAMILVQNYAAGQSQWLSAVHHLGRDQAYRIRRQSVGHGSLG